MRSSIGLLVSLRLDSLALFEGLSGGIWSGGVEGSDLVRRVRLIEFGCGRLIGEEGSEENLVGLDVSDRPLFVQVSLGIPKACQLILFELTYRANSIMLLLHACRRCACLFHPLRLRSRMLISPDGSVHHGIVFG